MTLAVRMSQLSTDCRCEEAAEVERRRKWLEVYFFIC